MKAIVVYNAVGHVELRDFQELPNDLIIAYMEPFQFVNANTTYETSTVDSIRVKKIRLERHLIVNVSGGFTRDLVAYWPSTWLDQWGVDEVDKFIKREEARVGSPYPEQQNSGPAYSPKSSGPGTEMVPY